MFTKHCQLFRLGVCEALVPFAELRHVTIDLRDCANGTGAVCEEDRAHLSTFFEYWTIVKILITFLLED